MDVNWLIEILGDFYWNKGDKTWGKIRNDQNHRLSLVLGWNRRGRFLVMTEERGNKPKRIFFLEGIEARRWWRFMKSIFKLAEVPIINPFKNLSRSLQSQFLTLSSLHSGKTPLFDAHIASMVFV